MLNMKTHPEIVAASDLAIIADLAGVSIHTVRSWGQRGRIPGQYWQAFVEAGAAELSDLAATMPPRKQREAA